MTERRPGPGAADRASGDDALRLLATGPDDAQLMMPLVQDALIRPSDMAWTPRRHELALLLIRYRWERPRPPSRVRSLWLLRGVRRVARRGFAGVDDSLPLVLLGATLNAAADPEDPSATVLLHFAHEGGPPRDLRLAVEAIDWLLEDVSAPWPAGRQPDHA